MTSLFTRSETIAGRAEARGRTAATIGIKVNLYRAYEVTALASVLTGDLATCPLECLMVGDSYLMTHLGRPSTRLGPGQEQRWALDLLASLVAEVRVAIDGAFRDGAIRDGAIRDGAIARPYLLADLPDGSARSTAQALASAGAMLEAGAEAVKLEVGDDSSLRVLASLSAHGIPTVAHLGYTPQVGRLARYGDTLAGAMALFEQARGARDAGAAAIVLEMTSEAVNQALSRPGPGSVPVYSIHSGRARYGAQSLNVWDAVFRQPGPGRFFPPTAELDPGTDRRRYTPELIASKLDQLLRLTIAGQFPPSPPSRLGEDERRAVVECDPWAAARTAPPRTAPHARSLPAPADPFELESGVRSYCRRFPAVFTRARNHLVWDEEGRRYVDFLSGAGALNYGHNHPAIVSAMVDYIAGDGIVHGMDLHTAAKRDFIGALHEVVLGPRGLDYRLQFTGPTGTNAVEAAFKIARTATGRQGIVAFTNGFHGMTLGALAATATAAKRAGAGVGLGHVTRMPYDGYLGDGVDTMDLVTALLDDPGSGVDTPAAFVVETVQGEGGVNTASNHWLARLAEVASTRGILLIVDDIQTGCGRTGRFFGFEEAGLYPDLVCLSKSLGGAGLPVALVLVRPELDRQAPGEHSGTFRGNNLAFVAGTAALALWVDGRLEAGIAERAGLVEDRLGALARRGGASGAQVRGRGLLRGIAWPDRTRAERVSRAAFGMGLLAETCGSFGHVLKVMPPLTIDLEGLSEGLDILDEAAAAAP